MSDIVFLTAAEMARHIRSGELSAREVMAAHLAQIERVNSQVNAIVTLLPERAMDAARAASMSAAWLGYSSRRVVHAAPVTAAWSWLAATGRAGSAAW